MYEGGVSRSQYTKKKIIRSFDCSNLFLLYRNDLHNVMCNHLLLIFNDKYWYLYNLIKLYN